MGKAVLSQNLGCAPKHQTQTASPFFGSYSKTRLPTLMEILLRVLRDTCHILPSILRSLRYSPTFIDIVYMCKGVPILLHSFAHQFHKLIRLLVHFEGALLRTGAHPEDSKVTSFTARFMVAYDGLWCSVSRMSWISQLQNPRFQRVTDIVSWHDQVHVVAEHGLFLGGGTSKSQPFVSEMHAEYLYAILYIRTP